MKKALSLVLALAIIMSLGITALADDGSDTTLINSEAASGTKTIDVNVTKADGAAGVDAINNRYYVVVAWEITQPKYTSAGAEGTTYTWNGSNQTYETATVAGSAAAETAGNAKITVTNKSDKAIKASAAYYAESDNGTSWAGVATDQEIAAVAGTGTLSAAQTKQDYGEVTPSNHEFNGALALNSYVPTSDNEKIGTITVTIAGA